MCWVGLSKISLIHPEPEIRSDMIMITIITDADESRVSKALVRVCLSVRSITQQELSYRKQIARQLHKH